MTKKRKIIIIAVAVSVFILFGGTVALSMMGRPTPLTGAVNKVQSVPCEDLAQKLLKAKQAQYSFHRCESTSYKVLNSRDKVTKVYVVAGAVEKQWEFECGFNADCATYTGWFDENGALFDIPEPPRVANFDPAVFTLGCGHQYTASDTDTEVDYDLVFEHGTYWWKIDYHNTPTRTEEGICRVTGTSLYGDAETRTNVSAEYLFETDNCDVTKLTLCQTAKALKTKSPEACKFNEEGSDGVPLVYNSECVSNYIARSGDKTLCGETANFGDIIDCEMIDPVRQL